MLAADEEIKKLQVRLNTVKNNAEYQATLFQIESVKRDRDQTQEECLKILDVLEPAKAEADEAESAAAAEQAVFDEFLQKAELVRKETDEKVKDIVEQRQQLAEQVPEDLLRTYDGMFTTRQGLAVASVEGGFCQGCYNKITTNDTAKLMGGAAVVECGSCQRILYLDR